MSRILVALSLLALPGAAFAQSNTTSAGPTATSATSGQQQAESGQPPKRIRDITLTAGQYTVTPDHRPLIGRAGDAVAAGDLLKNFFRLRRVPFCMTAPR